MGLYRASDLRLAPNVISLMRVPLAAAFPFAAQDSALALALLFTSGATDMADGWIARRYGLATAIGAVIDPITDKLFVATVVITLIATGRMPLWGALLLAAREIGEAPLVARVALSRARRRAKTEQPKANLPGKLATALQFLTVTLALVGSAWLQVSLVVTAIGGALAAVSYWMRELAEERALRPPPEQEAQRAERP